MKRGLKNVGMKITKQPKWKGYIKKLKNLNSEMALMSNDLISGIYKRTEGGSDYKNKPLKRYTREYAKSKGQTKVSLVDTGEMLGSMDSKKTKTGLKLYFGSGDAIDKAYHQHIKQGRKFFNLDLKQIEFVKSKLGKFIVKTKK